MLKGKTREFCGRHDGHPYELSLQIKDIEHRTAKVNRPQSSTIAEWFRRTLLEEHLRVEGRRINGPTPWQAFQEGLPGANKTTSTTEQKERMDA